MSVYDYNMRTFEHAFLFHHVTQMMEGGAPQLVKLV